MSGGFYVYKMEDGYAVKDQFGYTLKTAKTVKTLDRYVQLQLQTRRAAERYAKRLMKNIEKSNDSST